MIFPFTFKFSVPGIINPFASSSSSSSTNRPVQDPPETLPDRTQTPTETPPLEITRPRPPRSQSITPPVIISRKRAWDPAFAEPQDTTGLTTALDNSTDYRNRTSAITKYRSGMAALNEGAAEYHEVIDNEELPPAAKRRRGLAGSIVSTALSAALIGTAVGLTVYRLWRDRGKSTSTKDQQQPSQSLQPRTPRTTPHALLPPPPYQETDRTPGPTTPTKSLRKQRLAGSHHSKRGSYHTTPHSYSRQRSTRPRGQVPPQLAAAALFPQAQQHEELHNEVDDQMDWIGDKLSALVAEGKKALGREIVVMSDAKEDEVDDGSGAWEDSAPEDTSPDPDTDSHHSGASYQTPSRSRSIRRRRAGSPRSLRSPKRSGSRKRQHATSPLPSSPPRKAGPSAGYFDQVVSPSRHVYSASTSCLPLPAQSAQRIYPAYALTSGCAQQMEPMTPRRTHTHGYSLDSSSPAAGAHGLAWTCSEDIASFQSPELRETMERARQRAWMARTEGRGGDP